jgi:transcriptional regulator with XRE-family HTH domain
MTTIDLLLEQSGQSLEDFATKAGLSLERAESIADGRWTPSPAERERIAAAFQVPVESISWGHTMNPRNVRYRRFGLKENF